ncbi:cryptochrome/DNA photolyase [Chloropicon primus]|uniref:Cryptochrome/DNA photolyase n=1 Tax=Chloropicon primus TaxID=1764295 RepID=A0A5B8MG56_9CHLO|nr:cryptochrome/DNA photolyase [Chloropicon primus]|eukprot:QDZ19648.1 cryptochrome/DNA photolyase [Chloropicon primus]
MVAVKKEGGPLRKRSLVWFRKGLRVHDNPALLEASQSAAEVYPVFVLDPSIDPTEDGVKIGANRAQFLLESLEDLDQSLKKLGSHLICIRGRPEDVLPPLMRELDINHLGFEFDTEPYWKAQGEKMAKEAENLGARVHCPATHTLYDPEHLMAKCMMDAPKSYGQFLKLVAKCGSPPAVASAPESLPQISKDVLGRKHSGVPTLRDLGYEPLPASERTPFPGGETEALRRLEDQFRDTRRIALFEKPKTSPTDFETPSTTVLSPYLKFGCLSSRVFYFKLKEAYRKNGKHADPPVSLLGQLYWREFFYLCGYAFPNFGKMEGNPICRQIPWDHSEGGKEKLRAWESAQTGYPFIDAAMTQLRQQGWLHHLARHAVACFLTRGDLWVSWEEGRKVFDKLLIDADWSLNNANWMWLSCSSFFYQYFRCYSPVAFGRKYDPSGKYIRNFVPALRKMPKQYIYEPWKAPLSVQEAAGCIVGVDYPMPVCDHAVASKENMSKMAAAYKKAKSESPPPKKKAKKAK